MDFLLNLAPHLINGIGLGLLFALIALGFMLIVGVMEVINLAHGSLFALGAYFAMMIIGLEPEWFGPMGEWYVGLPVGLRYSVALVLAAFKIVEVSVGIVEPMIALSIMYVAAENFFSWFPLKRWMISFGFGLIHGLAFAQGLQMLDLPRAQFAMALLSFNLGIELAQVMIVAIAFPALMLMAEAPWRERTIRALSLVIFCLGTTWLVERVFW